MDKLLIGNDTAVITMLLLFIAGLLTKRFVPWWVYEDVLTKLKAYEQAAPELILEMKQLMELLDKSDDPEVQEERKNRSSNLSSKATTTNVIAPHATVRRRTRRPTG